MLAISLVFLAVLGQARAERNYAYVVTVGPDPNIYDFNMINKAVSQMITYGPNESNLGCIKVYPGVYEEHLNKECFPGTNNLPAHCDLIGIGEDINDIVIRFKGIHPPVDDFAIWCEGDNVVSNLKLWNYQAPAQWGIMFAGDGELRHCIVFGWHGAVVGMGRLVVSGCPDISTTFMACVGVWGGASFEITDSTLRPRVHFFTFEDPTGITAYASHGRIDNVRIICQGDGHAPALSYWGVYGIDLVVPADKFVEISNTTIDLELESVYDARYPDDNQPISVCGIHVCNRGWDDMFGNVFVHDCNISVRGIEQSNPDPTPDGAGLKVDGIHVWSGTTRRPSVTVWNSSIKTQRVKAGNAEDGYEYLLNNENGNLYVDFNTVSFDPNGPNPPNCYDPNYVNGTVKGYRVKNITKDIEYFYSIQEAIDEADNGNVIKVLPSLYKEAIEFKGKSIILTGDDPNNGSMVETTVISAPNPNSTVVTFENAEDANSILRGLTIMGGEHGVDCDGASPTIANCIIRNNSSSENGGGMTIMSGSPKVKNCTFSENSGAYGGAVYCCGEAVDMNDCRFIDNTATYGGAIYNEYYVTLTNCEFSRNSATTGGAIVNWYNVILNNCTFGDNSATNVGAVYNLWDATSTTFTNCVFSGNHASGTGAVFNDFAGPAFVNCTFAGNYASGPNSVGGAVVNRCCNPSIVNCIFWGNNASAGKNISNYGGSNPNISYSDIEGCKDSNGIWDSNLGTDGGGNINGSPCFIDANNPAGADSVLGTFDDGLRLKGNSLCIDAGDGNSASLRDIVGNARRDIPYFDNTGTGTPNYVDIGAYEFQLWYVDCDTNGDNDGTSWQNAFEDLQDALAYAGGGDMVWVAKGTYKPTSGNDRSTSFKIEKNVNLFGGFDGNEISVEQRNFLQNETILSGDIGTIDDHNDNSYHVVENAANAVLDGFTIANGYANGTDSDAFGGGIYNCGDFNMKVINCTLKNNSATCGGGACSYEAMGNMFRNCKFAENTATYGGAISNFYSVGATISNSTFSSNSAEYGGAVYYEMVEETSFVNCLFSNNYASSDGGGMFKLGSNPVITNCTFNGNCAFGAGGAMLNYFGDASIVNCILWGNNASAGKNISNYGGSNPTISYSDTEGCKDSNGVWDPNLGTDGGGNINSEPLFIDPDNGDLHLRPNSPCINAGDPNGDYSGQTDIDGQPRVMGDRVDIGADEVGCATCPGDLDGDGWVTPDDLAQMVNILDAFSESEYQCELGTEGCTNWCADLDGDGWVTPNDEARLIVALQAHSESEYMYQCGAVCLTCPGDLDGDGWVTLDDLSGMVVLLSGFSESEYQCELGTEGCTNWCADLDGDGWVTLDDLSRLVNILQGAGEPNEYMVQCP